MGRYISGPGGQSSSGSGAGGAGSTFKLKTAVAVAINALLCLGPDGLAYPGQTVDYAAKPNVQDQAVAPTNMAAGSGGPAFYHRHNLVQHSSGDVYTFCGTNANANTDAALYRYSAGGTLLGYAVVDASFAAQLYDPWMVQLANGDLAVMYSTGSQIKHAVYTPELFPVKTATVVESVHSNQCIALEALPAGGYMACWQQNGTPLNMRLGVWDNTGTVVTAATTFHTFTGSNSSSWHRLKALSDGKILFTTMGASSGTQGFWLGKLTIAGGIDTAITCITPGVTAGYRPQVDVRTGYFVVGFWDGAGTGLNLRVYNNSLTQQGSSFVPGTTAMGTAAQNLFALANDGTDFYCCYGSNSQLLLSKITTAAAVTTFVLGANASGYGYGWDMFIERGRVVAGYSNSTPGFRFAVFNIASRYTEAVNKTIASGDYNYPRMIPGGDFTIIYVGTESTVKWGVTKYADTSVVGVAGTSVAAGANVAVNGLAGAYAVNALKGSSTKAFDHTSGANILGNKGTLLKQGVVLKGM